MNQNFEFFSFFDYAQDVFTYSSSEYNYVYSLDFLTLIFCFLSASGFGYDAKRNIGRNIVRWS